MRNNLGFGDIQSELHKGYKFPIESVKADKVWDKTKGEDVRVMLIDTGLESEHKDLKHSFVDGMDMFDKSKNVYDDYGHGTAVAGLITGLNTGVSPQAKLYTAKVLDVNGSGSMLSVLEGITYASTLKVDILCMSLGIQGGLPLQLQDRINKLRSKGIVVVSATGNHGSINVDYPAKLDSVIGVGSIDKNLEHSWFSNFDKGLDFVTPAENTSTTYINNQYTKVTGTSFASPVLAGCIALIISYAKKKGLKLTPMEIKDLLIKSASKGYYHRSLGWGLPNVEKVLEEIDRNSR